MKHLLAIIVFCSISMLVFTTGISAQTTPVKIIDFLTIRFSEQKLKLDDICRIKDDALSARIFKEYGAVFISVDAVTPPPKCIFESETELAAFQNRLQSRTETIGGTTIDLQADAMELLLRAVKDAERRGKKITPRGGKTAASRSFADTQRIWDSRFFPGLTHWTLKEKISAADAEAAKKMTIPNQVRKVLEWEAKGYFFSTGKDRTILSSVAAPGTSQHLSMLALDVTQFADPLVRQILNMHGWYQTVADDTPHFTYLGVPEADLPARGLKPVARGGYTFWVPNI